MRAAVKTLLELLQNADIPSYIFEAPFQNAERFDMGLRLLLLPNEDGRYATVLQRVQRL